MLDEFDSMSYSHIERRWNMVNITGQEHLREQQGHFKMGDPNQRTDLVAGAIHDQNTAQHGIFVNSGCQKWNSLHPIQNLMPHSGQR
jgi:hypothetical protein